MGVLVEERARETRAWKKFPVEYRVNAWAGACVLPPRGPLDESEEWEAHMVGRETIRSVERRPGVGWPAQRACAKIARSGHERAVR